MRLADAASYFDRTVCADAYNPSTTFLGQTEPFDDSRRDGLTIERRILSVGPAISLPARKTIKIDGTPWMVGQGSPDYFNGSVIRNKLVIHQAQGLASVKTFAEALASSAGLQAYAARVWVKEGKEADTSSDLHTMYDIYFAPGETLVEHTLVSLSGRWHIIQSVYPSAGGLLVALADELPEPVVTTAAFTLRTYVPLTDDYTTTSATVAAIRIRWQEHFRYLTRASSKYGPGDLQLAVLKSAITPQAGDLATVAGENYRVESLSDDAPVWSLHLCHV